MSVKATSYVYEQSPYELGALLVYLAIADVANDQNDDLIWLTQARIAAKVRVSVRTVAEAMTAMVRDGYLELVDAPAGKVRTYRFLTPAKSAGVPADPRKSCGGTPATERDRTSTNANGTQGPNATNPDPPVPFEEGISRMRSALRPGPGATVAG